MPLFGAHMSIAGGLWKAAEAAAGLDCGTVQLFSKNASQWSAKPIPEDEAKAFRAAVRKAKLKSATVHDSYLINLAAPGEELFKKSTDAFVDELTRAEQLGVRYLVSHPGAHVGSGEDEGLKRVAEGLNEALRRTAGFRVKVLLENTAGMGTTLGYRFEHLASLIDAASEPARVAVCFDTCHAFAAGYDLSTDAGYDATFDEFDRVVGLKKLKVLHVNDSVKPLGSRVDRHAGLGLGHIGEGAFRRLATDPRFADRPMILETPKEDADGRPMDPVNLGKLRGYVAAPV